LPAADRDIKTHGLAIEEDRPNGIYIVNKNKTDGGLVNRESRKQSELTRADEERTSMLESGDSRLGQCM
jgi:hypothetical protein